MIITSEPVLPLTLVRCRPIGIFRMEDSGEIDEKILAICINDPSYKDIQNIADLPNAPVLKKYGTFFSSL